MLETSTLGRKYRRLRRSDVLCQTVPYRAQESSAPSIL